MRWPHASFTIADLCRVLQPVAYSDTDSIEKKHRVALIRSANAVAKSVGYKSRVDGDDRLLVFYNPKSERSRNSTKTRRRDVRDDKGGPPVDQLASLLEVDDE